jgi:hypothetical protein
MLVLLIKGINEAYAVEMATCGVIYVHTKFCIDGYWRTRNIKVLTQKF